MFLFCYITTIFFFFFLSKFILKIIFNSNECFFKCTSNFVNFIFYVLVILNMRFRKKVLKKKKYFETICVHLKQQNSGWEKYFTSKIVFKIIIAELFFCILVGAVSTYWIPMWKLFWKYINKNEGIFFGKGLMLYSKSNCLLQIFQIWYGKNKVLWKKNF